MQLENCSAEAYKINGTAQKNTNFAQPNQAHCVDKLENPEQDKINS